MMESIDGVGETWYRVITLVPMGPPLMPLIQRGCWSGCVRT